MERLCAKEKTHIPWMDDGWMDVLVGIGVEGNEEEIRAKMEAS